MNEIQKNIERKDKYEEKNIEKSSNHSSVESKNINPYSSNEVNDKKYINTTNEKNIISVNKTFDGYNPQTNNKDNKTNDIYNNKLDNKEYNDDKNPNNIINNNFELESVKENKDINKDNSKNDNNIIDNCNINNKNNTIYNHKEDKNNNKDDNNINDKVITYNNKISILNNIKSKYILNFIFGYIKNKNYPYILFNYSKLLQKKLDLTLNSYKEKYNEQLKLEEIEVKYLDSPLFKEKLSKGTIYILLRNDDYEKYKIEYNSILNKKNIEYSSIYFMFDNNINFIKEINIDFNKIKKITLHKGHEFKTNNDLIFKTLFSLNDIENNLISLTIRFRWNEDEFTQFLGRKSSGKVDTNLFEKINNFKELRYLYLISINFDKNVTIKLNSLKVLLCSGCENLSLSGIICPKLRKLYYYNKGESNKIDYKNIDLKELKGLKELYFNSEENIIEKVWKENNF